MALSNSTIKNLSIALTSDVIDDIFQDERYIELLMELIPEFVAKNLQSEDYDMVVEIAVCIMDNIAMKPRKTLGQLAQGHWIPSGDLSYYIRTWNTPPWKPSTALITLLWISFRRFGRFMRPIFLCLVMRMLCGQFQGLNMKLSRLVGHSDNWHKRHLRSALGALRLTSQPRHTL